MKSPNLQKTVPPKSVSRRKFLATSTATAAGLTIIPRRVLGGFGYVPPSDKLNLAFIGVGAQGMRVMLHFLKEPDVQGVAVCDVNQSGSNYPQWSTHEFANSVNNLLGVSSGWDWLSPDQPIQLSHTLKVTGGVAGRDPAQKIVDAYNAQSGVAAPTTPATGAPTAPRPQTTRPAGTTGAPKSPAAPKQ